MSLEKVTSSDHAQGASGAPITLVEYGDYQCPYCGEAYYIVKKLQQKLGDKLQFVFRNYPLQELHEHAVHAAIAAETAGLEGKFWEMHDIIFENQRRLDDASLVQYAASIGLDKAKFEKDFGSKPTVDKVNADVASGDKAKVDSTPSFFVNGAYFSGNWTNNEFLQYLEKLL
ncbi:MAG: DsbA family protein [Candidatus Symbiothrix sp.]|jgi:protein-disulfide isomerase|nr:DsbA family protein [Candidatus Symbiothrix sp.]